MDTVIGPEYRHLTDTIIGAGERFLIIGVFAPTDSLQFSDSVGPGSTAVYMFDNAMLYRADCPNASVMTFGPMPRCAGTEVSIYGDYPPQLPRQWYVDGDPVTSTSSSIDVITALDHDIDIMLVGDTGICMDTARYTLVTKGGAELFLPDTFLVCDVISLDPLVTWHVFDTSLTAPVVEWQHLTTWEMIETSPQLQVTLADTGTYRLTLNYGPCEHQEEFHVGPNKTLLDANASDQDYLLVEVGPEHCVNQNDGSIQIHDNGYPGVVHCSWIEPPLTILDTSMVTGLGEGQYEVQITDDMGRCSSNTVEVPLLLDGCSVVAGSIYDDIDRNCVLDPLDHRLEGAVVVAEPIGNVALSNEQGEYELYVPQGAYTFTRTYPDPFMANLCGDGAAVQLNAVGQMVNASFADTVHQPVRDLSLQPLWWLPWIVGVDGLVFVNVLNEGEIPEHVELRMRVGHPSLFPDTLGTPEFLDTSGDTLRFDLGMVDPGSLTSLTLPVPVPADPDLIGSTVWLWASVTAVPEEEDLSDNHAFDGATIVGSYDPNDKQMMPPPTRDAHLIDTTYTTVRYTVRFQNTGNYPATRVLLRDTIDAELDPSSLRLVAHSHPVQVFVYEGVAYFDHLSIMLPDSMSDPDGSQGFVRFDLDTRFPVNIGDSLTNTAYIYFDQNPPIVTNTVTAIYGANVYSGFSPERSSGNLPFVVPNPARDQLVLHGIHASEVIRAVRILNAQGGIVDEPMMNGDRQMDVGSLASGIYVLQAITTSGTYTARFVIAR